MKNNLSIEERNKIILDNVWIVNGLIGKYGKNPKTDVQELKASAIAWMIYGMKNYDPNGPASASSFLFWWARRGAMEYMFGNRVVHIPHGKILKQIAINKTAHAEQHTNILPTEHSIEAIMQIDRSDQSNQSFTGDLQLEFIRTTTADNNNVVYSSSEVHEHISYILSKPDLLTPIEKFVVVHRYGLEDNTPKLQKEIANLMLQHFGKSYSTVGICQIEKRAKKKLREDEELQHVLYG